MLQVKPLLGAMAGLLLATLTFYLVLKYAFVQPSNYCRMTFMMEPPKFLTVPIEPDLVHQDGISTNTTITSHQHYRLFMYSEFDFPQSNNPQQDLKDSMPVLFVPGNAGSYQQTRSLASTCIKRQLRSLEAAKFVFYTVSFGEQLSGINGRLLIEQIEFVSRAIKQIKRNHPEQSGGIILIGHSVGGFISKALFTMPDFPPESVGLIISLAGPLTSLPLFFDNDVRDLYERTSQHWNKLKTENSNTRFVALSISGGYSDRLVPPHLAMDPHFDISITTNALSGVWLPTDHVPITWCRELMHKLSILMSSVMDKRTTRLITVERQKMINTIKTQLIGGFDSLISQPKLEIIGNWTSTKAFRIMDKELFYHDQRYRLRNELKILTLDDYEDVFILIEHVENLPQKWITGCDNKIQQTGTDKRMICTNRIDLSFLARSIPSRYYEPQTSFLIIPSSLARPRNLMSVIIDLVPDSDGIHDSTTTLRRMPETFSYLRIGSQDYIKNIYLPTVYGYIWNQLVSLLTNRMSFRSHINASPGSPLHYMRFYLPGFNHFTQTYLVTLEAVECVNGIPERGLLLFRAPWSLESYHSPLTNDDISRLKMDLRLMKTFKQGANSHESAYLELFIDGNCEYNLNLRFNFLELFNIIVQYRLGSILTCIAMILITSIKSDCKILRYYEKIRISNAKNYYDSNGCLDRRIVNTMERNSSSLIVLLNNVFTMSMILGLSNFIFNLLAPNLETSEFNLSDEIVIIFSIYTYSFGAVIASRFVVGALIWLLSQISLCFNAPSFSSKQSTSNGVPHKGPKSLIAHHNGYSIDKPTEGAGGCSKEEQIYRPFIKYLNPYNTNINLSGLVLIVAIILGVFWCSFWLSLTTTTILLIRSVKNRRNSTIQVPATAMNGKTCDLVASCEASSRGALYRLDTNILLLTVLCVIPTIPNALIFMQDKNSLVNLTTSKMLDQIVFISIPAPILAYMFMQKAFRSIAKQGEIDDILPKKSRDMHTKTIQNLRELFYLPVLLIESNIYFLSVTQLTTLVWLACS